MREITLNAAVRIKSCAPKFVENIVQAVRRDILAYAMKTLSHCFCWLVGIGDLGNIHYSRGSNAPMNL